MSASAVACHELASSDLELITFLYEGRFKRTADYVDLEEWCRNRGSDRAGAMKLYTRLNRDGIIESQGCGLYPGLTTEGITLCERLGVSTELTARQEELRHVLLEEGLRTWEEEGLHAYVDWRATVRDNGFGEAEYSSNFFYLKELYLIEPFCAGGFRLTEVGVDVARRLRSRKAFEVRWRDLLGLVDITPQRRGHALEDLLADLARFEGLEVDLRVRSNGEENDLVISQHYHHFLVSCKWEESQRAKAEYLDLLRARLAKRPGTCGLLVSVGGFSDELIPEAEANTSLGLVILCGKGNLERFFSAGESISDFLLRSHTDLVKYRKVNPLL